MGRHQHHANNKAFNNKAGGGQRRVSWSDHGASCTSSTSDNNNLINNNSNHNHNHHHHHHHHRVAIGGIGGGRSGSDGGYSRATTVEGDDASDWSDQESVIIWDINDEVPRKDGQPYGYDYSSSEEGEDDDGVVRIEPFHYSFDEWEPWWSSCACDNPRRGRKGKRLVVVIVGVLLVAVLGWISMVTFPTGRQHQQPSASNNDDGGAQQQQPPPQSLDDAAAPEKKIESSGSPPGGGVHVDGRFVVLRSATVNGLSSYSSVEITAPLHNHGGDDDEEKKRQREEELRNGSRYSITFRLQDDGITTVQEEQQQQQRKAAKGYLTSIHVNPKKVFNQFKANVLLGGLPSDEIVVQEELHAGHTFNDGLLGPFDVVLGDITQSTSDLPVGFDLENWLGGLVVVPGIDPSGEDTLIGTFIFDEMSRRNGNGNGSTGIQGRKRDHRHNPFS